MGSAIGMFLRRPIGVISFYILVLALAVAAIIRLPVALFPSLRYPLLVVWTAFPEAAPDQVERAVTEVIEEALAGTSGLAGITSRSQLGGSLVRLDFGWNIDLDLAALELREKLDRIAGALPDSSERPLVLRVDSSDRPILLLALSSDDAAAGRKGLATPQESLQLKQLAREVVARRLEQLPGVARVRVTGGHEPEIGVEVSAEGMAAYGVDLEQIAQALREANVVLSGGVVRNGPFYYPVEVSGEFRNAEEVAETVVSAPGDPPVRLREIAKVREGTARRRGMVRLDGRETLLLLVERRPDANIVQTARDVREALAGLRTELPGIRLDPVVDESLFIESAIGWMTFDLVAGGILTILILLVFLRRPQALLATALAVPLSLALTFVLFDLLGITFNLISLSGLALGVGLLLDNSTVVVENIARLREEGVESREAARRGAAEVAGPITASTLTTVAVFLPITLVEGLAGRLFRDQSLAIVCSVLASLLVALTVVPLIAASDRGAAGDPARQAGHTVLRLYERSLIWCLRHPRRTLIGTGILLAITSGIALRLPRETVPRDDEGRVEVSLTLPTDADLDLVSMRALPIENSARAWPGVKHVLADLGERDDARLEIDPRPMYRSTLTLVLDPEAPSSETLSRLRDLEAPSDVALEARSVRPQIESLLVLDEADLLIDLVAADRSASEQAFPRLFAALNERKELKNLARTDPQGVPSYRIDLDRDAIVRLGARSAVLQTYLEAAARGVPATRLLSGSEEIPVVLQTRSFDSMNRLLGERVPTATGLLPLRSFLRVTQVSVPAVLLRARQGPILRLTADTAPRASLQEAVRAVEETVRRLRLPDSVRVHVGGANDAFRQSLVAVAKTLLLSLLLVYLILAAQFESLIHPFVILAAVPLAATGVVLSLALTGQSWNLMSLTACVVVVGIVDNDAIVKVDFINRARQAGLTVEEAILQAGHHRFRPIVMNTLTAVLGLLPLALGLGQGGGLQSPLAITIIGGLVSATALTLVVVPVVYMILARHRLLPVPEGEASL